MELPEVLGRAAEAAQVRRVFGEPIEPAGVFVIRGDQVDWRPALDLGKVILGGQLVAVTFLLVLRSILRRR